MIFKSTSNILSMATMDWVLAVQFFCLLQTASTKKMNVLFLVSDDMRPQLGAYEGPYFPAPVHPTMHTPNLDALAKRSLLLKRAYVQQAVCSPSRTSVLTGRRPDTTHIWDMTSYFRRVSGNITTIPQYFKQQGYVSVGMGKVFHPGAPSGHDDPISWSEKYFHANLSMWGPEQQFSWTAADDARVQKYPLADMQIANHAVDTLKRLAPKALTGEQPFFVAVGFHRPHLPFLCPQKFYDYYPKEVIRLPANPYVPLHMPEAAWGNFADLRAYKDIAQLRGHGSINMTYPDQTVKELRRGYYACVSYTDSLVGQVIRTLDDLGLRDSTVIAFWGDHGWQMGEHAEWTKCTNFELATHAPMMVSVPGLTDQGVATEELTEFVDLFPTLAEVAGLPPVPLCPPNSSQIELCSEGVSMVPLMKDPKKPWKSGAFSQYPRINIGGDDIMGYTIKTDKYRYTEWGFYDRHAYKVVYWGNNGRELYDHTIDPQENVNRAWNPQYKTIVAELQKKLHAGWRKALPPGM